MIQEMIIKLLRYLIFIITPLSIFLLLKYTYYNFENFDILSQKKLILLIMTNIFLVIIFFLKTEISIKIILVLASLVTSIYIVEGLIRIKSYYNSVEYHAKKNGNFFDSRSRYEYYLDSKKKNPDVVISIYPYVSQRYIKNNNKDKTLLPLGGISNKDTIFCNEGGFFVNYKSDLYGFTNPNGEWKKKNQILFVGDSYAQGVCVDEKKNIIGNLRNINKNNLLGLINLGQKGNGPLTELASLIEYSSVTSPKKIFWLYYEGNDLKNLKSEYQNETLKKYLDNDFSQKLVSKQKEIDKLLLEVFFNRLDFEKKTYTYIKNNKIISFIKLMNLRDLIKSYMTKKRVDDLEFEKKIFNRIMKKTKIISQEMNSELYFVYIPSYLRIYEKYTQDVNLFNYSSVKKIVKSLDINFIDLNILLFKDLENSKLMFPYGLHKHFNEKGYREIAKILSKYVQN